MFAERGNPAGEIVNPDWRVFKGHGLGNDYLAVNGAELASDRYPELARLLCDRNRGVGSDGLLVLTPSRKADFGVRILNPDGSEAEKSGNGLRVLACYLETSGKLSGRSSFTVETASGVVQVEVLEERDFVLEVAVEMGSASFRPEDVGLAAPWCRLEVGEEVVEFTPISVGNPHCVVFEDRLDRSRFLRLAPELSTHASFGNGVNVQFAVAARSKLEAWVWERGAGETLASGSSACAVAAAAVRRGELASGEIEVRMPGGTLLVTVRPDWSLRLRGPVEPVGWFEPAPALLAPLASGLLASGGDQPQGGSAAPTPTPRPAG
ncbi:MAG: diaminopimelate epimerase [Longimicrobiaceae bacterium]